MSVSSLISAQQAFLRFPGTWGAYDLIQTKDAELATQFDSTYSTPETAHSCPGTWACELDSLTTFWIVLAILKGSYDHLDKDR